MAGLRPMGVSVRTHLSSQDSQFNSFIGVSVEDMSRTVWMCVCDEGLYVRKAWVCVVSRRE